MFDLESLEASETVIASKRGNRLIDLVSYVVKSTSEAIRLFNKYSRDYPHSEVDLLEE